ncbi:SpoIIE family protein phosphatase, partial [candidate division GN15 bacterium]|nr:SpoIIE family protein phosphatase [candidate division GN15 bacterium]
ACASAGMHRKDTSAVLLAVEEGATNIIRHAYLYETGILRVRIVIYPKMVLFSLIDHGRSFKPEGTGKLDLERLVASGRRGGLGFYMIQKIMDKVEYYSSSTQNELRLTKRLVPLDEKGAPPLLRRMFTLRVKFSLWTFFIVSLIIGGAFYFINDRTTREIYSHLDGTVNALSKTIAEQAALYIINRRSDVEFDELVISYYTSNPVLQRIVLTDSTDLIIAHSDDIHNIRKPYRYPAYADPDVIAVPQRTSIEGKEINYLSLPIVSGERRLGRVHVTYSSEPVQQQLAESQLTILKLTGVLVLIGIIGIYLLSNYFVTPIVNITRRVRRFSSGDLESELPLEGADEFFEISNALNEMMTRLRRDRETVIERERMAKEIEVASQIQKTLLPRELPQMPGLEIDAFYRAASIIGGDLYDIFDTGDGRCCMVVADVSGKGVPASLVMSMLRTVIKIHAHREISARATLISVNDYLTENMPQGMFITVLMAIYDVAERRLNFVSAGHNPLLLYKATTRRVIRINPSGMPLGVPVTLEKSFRESLEEVEVQLDQGDLFLLYTDGITEAVNREGKQFGVERLSDLLRDCLRDGNCENIRDLSKTIIDELDTYVGYASQMDDVTFVVGRTLSTEEDSARHQAVVETRQLRSSGTGSA